MIDEMNNEQWTMNNEQWTLINHCSLIELMNHE